jgi:hypothetical protein
MDYLYRQIGEATHLAQTLELYLATLISIANQHFDVDIDVEGAIIPDYRKTLGQLLQQFRAIGTVDQNGEQMLAEALAKRNYIAHEFFKKNVFAFNVPEVFERTKQKLEADTKAIAVGVALAQGWLSALCEALEIDKSRMLFQQEQPDGSHAQQ